MNPLTSALFASLLLFAPTVAEAKASFACHLIDVQIVEAPGFDDVEIIAAVRLACQNKTAKPVRIKVANVFLLNTEGDKYRPERNTDNFDVIFEDLDPGPEFVDHFVDIKPGTSVELGFTFRGGTRLTDPDLVLDVSGVQYPRHRSAKNRAD